MRGLAILALGLLSAASSACGPRFDPAPIRNVLLVSIDTLRADRLSCYGYPKQTSPTIDALAEDGARFELAVASNPMTLPSHATMLTGTLPPRHGVRDNDGYRLAEDRLTLAEILAERGFATGAAVGAGILARRYGLDQGFGAYDDDVGFFVDGYPTRPAGEVSAAGVRYIDAHAGEPFFLFLHYYDPHHHYAPPEPFRTRFADDPYAGEIAYTDSALGTVVEALRRHGLYDSTLILVTSDHGEDFGEHDETGHSWFIYQSTQHVPLVIRAPGMRGSRVVPGAVGIVDVVPTVLGLLAVDAPEGLQGRDLSPLLRGEEAPDRERYVYCESYTPTKLGCSPLLGLVSERWKYIHTVRPELYDIGADPVERNNHVEAEPERVRELAERVERVRAESRPGDRFFDPGAEKYLLALGYLKGQVDEEARVDTSLRDAKDALEEFNRLRSVAAHIRDEEYETARRIARDLLRLRPDLIDVHRMLGDIAFHEKDWPTVVVKYDLYQRLAGAGVGLGLEGDAEERRIGDLYQRRAVAHANLGKPDLAEADFRRARELYPELAQSHYNLAHLLLERPGREAEARELLLEALRRDPDYARAKAELAKLDAAE